MKLRRISIMCALVLLALVMMVAPVSAKNTVKSFTFMTPDWVEVYDPVETGAVVHFNGTGAGTVVVNTGYIELDSAKITTIFTAPLHPDKGYWGPAMGTFRIVVVTAPGEQESGWEGTLKEPPLNDPVKWPRAYSIYFQGNGFGIYKNTRIEFTTSNLVEDLKNRVFVGQISGL